MSEFQKNIIESLLKEKKKTKRELAKILNIKENSINRLLISPSITLSKLGIIAGFLDVDIIDLLPKKESLQETGLRHFAYEVDDVDEIYKRIVENGYEVICEPHTSDDGALRVFYVRDPEYNFVELMQKF